MPDPALPLVSVLTPVLNDADTIRQTIASVFEQDYPNLEQVVIDGGSTDGTVEIIRECAARYGDRLQWRSGPDRGPSHALNIGVGMARGEIIGWQNGDDYYLPGCISLLVKAMQADPGAAVAYTGCLRIDERGRTIDPWRVEPFSYELLLLQDIIANQSALVRREVLLEWPLSEDTLSMDYDLWLRIGLRHRFIHVPGVGGVFRLTKHTNTGAKPHLFARDHVRFLDEAMSDPLFPEELRPLGRQLLRRKLAVAVPLLAYHGQVGEARRHLQRLAGLRPGPRDWAYLGYRCLLGKNTLRWRALIHRLRPAIERTPVLGGILAPPTVKSPRTPAQP